MIELLKEKFNIISRIGKGGMAEIYSARYKDTGKQCAIKILNPDDNNEVAKKRFKEEIELTKKVESPYVVKIFDWWWDEKIQYIVMEHVDGGTLKEYVQAKTRLTVDEAVEFTKQLTLGFEAIHNAGIVHRDIKSANVLVTSYGQIKIIDFGIAITDASARLTKTDNIVGSPQYLAPEIVDLKPPTPSTDIYSLGILLYEMLTGKVPFSAKDSYSIVIMHQEKVVPQVNKIFSNIPQALANVVIKSTAKEPKQRYETMYDFYKDIVTCLDNSRLYEPVLNLSSKKKKTFLERINSKWTLFGIIGALVLIMLVTIVVLLMREF